MPIVLRVLVVALLVVGGLVTPSSGTLNAAPQTVTASADPMVHAADAIAMVDLVDVSGSLAKAIKAMTAAETQQLTSSLKPHDIYARINFDGTARVAVLMHVRAPADVQRITTVLTQNVSATGAHTSIAEGLAKAREVVEKERGSRRVVLALLTDGILSMPDIERERKQLEAIAGWWKTQSWARRIVVAVGDDKTGAAVRLARSLDAELVSLEDYAKRAVVARAITSTRAPVVASTATPPAPTPLVSRWLWALGVVAVFALLTYWGVRKKTPRSQAVPRVEPLPIATRSAVPETQISVRVTAGGRVVETSVGVAELENGILTLGAGGQVLVPGLPGQAVRIDVSGGSMALSVEPGVNVRLNGESVDAMPQPIDVGRQCRLSCGGVAIALRLHAGGTESRVPVAVVGLRRRIG